MPQQFELDRLATYDESSILHELRRVAKLVPGSKLSTSFFDGHSKVHSSTIRRRFGGWKNALERAGLHTYYSGRTVSTKMRSQVARNLSSDQLIEELQRVALKLSQRTLTTEEFSAHSEISSSALTRRFGSWNKALQKAGLSPRPHGRRHTDDEYYENLLVVWTHYGRQPLYREIDVAPSRISAGAYEAKWGSWKKALVAFIKKANEDLKHASSSGTQSANSLSNAMPSRRTQSRPPLPVEDRHKIPLGLRYSVLSRDRFRCTLCGSNPATVPSCELHVDHIIPFSKGGKTISDNLRTLCSNCNIGKADKAPEID